jgi:outer membrane protein assembly factor BamB
VQAALIILWLVAGARASTPEWTTYRQNAQRTGADVEDTSQYPPSGLWQSAVLDGDIYGEPLIYGSQVYVATENDTVYSLSATTGQITWKDNLGTPVASSALPCGDIQPTVGITGTPVIDPTTQTIYAVTDTWDGAHPSSIRHELVALDMATGAMRPGFPIDVDPPGLTADGGSPANQLQRPGLALDGSEVVIGYGGNDGDCAKYWGWLVAAPASGSGSLLSYRVDGKPGDEAGAIWGGGNAPPVDADGDIYTATGNGKSESLGDVEAEFDYGDAVLKLNPALQLQEYWGASDWRALDEDDLDLGSSAPVLLPGNMVFEIGKQGLGILLRDGAFGGLGAAPAAELQICGGSWGGGIYVAGSTTSGTLYVNCDDGLHAILVSGLGTAEPRMTVAPTWIVNPSVVGPPILADGLVWVASWYGAADGHLYALDPGTGAVRFESNLGAFVHFSTPSAAGGLLFAANGNQVTAFTISGSPAIAVPAPGTLPETPVTEEHLVVSGLRQSHRVWREGRRLARASISRASRHSPLHPVGTVFSFFLDGRAQVQFRFLAIVRGRRTDGRCRAATRRNRGRRPCELTLPTGSLSFAGRDGANALSFQGLLTRHRRLAPGAYRVIVTAGSGTSASAPASLVFVIAR